MSVFTYEKETSDRPLEQFEWDRTWHEQTENVTTKRILYIGDSISCNTCRLVTECAEGAYLFDGFGTSKGLDNPYYYESLRLFTAQQDRCDGVIFNNGLHGWHLDDETEYKKHYEDMLRFLGDHFPNVPLYLVLTTSVADPDRNVRVQKRNAVVRALAEEKGLPVIDLYAVSVANQTYQHADGVHFVKAGYEALAKAIVNALQASRFV